jgi:P27 family predicted phage terminase small subunit
MAGRKAIPISNHRLAGTFRKDRHAASEKAQKIDQGIPECPSWLSDRAKSAWVEVAPLLHARRVLTKSDGVALQLLCESYADWKRLRMEVSDEGETYRTHTPAGDEMIRPNPKVTLRDNAERYLRSSLVDFGLNPAARSKISAVDGMEEKDPWGEL